MLCMAVHFQEDIKIQLCAIIGYCKKLCAIIGYRSTKYFVSFLKVPNCENLINRILFYVLNWSTY